MARQRSTTAPQRRLVLIDWEDSGQPIPQWQWIDDMPAYAVIKCQTVGWLIQQDSKVTVVVQNVGDGEQVSGVMRIPTRCIVRLTDWPVRAPGSKRRGA
jgi:hypothetical protein